MRVNGGLIPFGCVWDFRSEGTLFSFEWNLFSFRVGFGISVRGNWKGGVLFHIVRDQIIEQNLCPGKIRQDNCDPCHRYQGKGAG